MIWITIIFIALLNGCTLSEPSEEQISALVLDHAKAWESAQMEANAAFGDPGMYLEKYIEEPRHIEIQIAGDQYGKACHLSERDCSVQRRHQKLVEESPSPFMTQKLRKQMGEAAIKAAKAVRYASLFDNQKFTSIIKTTLK
mgnify:CR=1 FL=1